MDYLIYIITTTYMLVYKSNLLMERIILIFFIIFFFSILYNINKYHHKHYGLFNKEICVISKHKFIEYLDRYYIKNIYFTTMMVILYIILNFLLFLVIRIYLFNKKYVSEISFPMDSDIFEQVNLKNQGWTMLFMPAMNMILFIIIMLLYKITLDRLFFTEVHKLHLFLNANKLYFHMKYQFTSNFYIKEFIEKLYLFFYNVSLLRIRSVSDNEEYFDFNAQNNIYENNTILELSKWCVKMSKKLRLFHIIMIILLKSCRMIYYRVIIYKLTRYFPYIFYLGFILYDITQAKMYYSYYMFFVFYLVIITIKYKTFLERRALGRDYYITKYFYKNSLDYEMQKRTLLNNSKKGFNTNNISVETQQLLFPHNESTYTKDLVGFVFNNFTTDSFKDQEKSDKEGYNRFARKDFFMVILTILLCCIIIVDKPIYITISNIVISMPIKYIFMLMYLITVLFWLNIYKSKPNNIDYEWDLFEYNKIYHIMFVITYLITFLIMMLTIIKSSLFWITDGIFFQWYNIEITYSYTLKEKIEYFYNYLNTLINNNDIPDNVIETIAIFIDELNIENLIMEETTLDINTYLTILNSTTKI